MYIDSHAHFDMLPEEHGISMEELLVSMKKAGVEHAVQISVESAGLEWSRNFASAGRDSGFLFTAGIHPSCPIEEENLLQLENFLLNLSAEDRELLFGIGETGLDYHFPGFSREAQIRAFERQVRLANSENLPVIIHTRDAWNDTLDILKRNPGRGLIHCFSGDRETAEKVLDMGFYISFAGNLTYKKAENLHETIKYVPADRLLLETDSPYLSPRTKRGKANRPEYIAETYAFAAEIRGEKPAELEERICRNFMEFREAGR